MFLLQLAVKKCPFIKSCVLNKLDMCTSFPRFIVCPEYQQRRKKKKDMPNPDELFIGAGKLDALSIVLISNLNEYKELVNTMPDCYTLTAKMNENLCWLIAQEEYLLQKNLIEKYEIYWEDGKLICNVNENSLDFMQVSITPIRNQLFINDKGINNIKCRIIRL